MPTIQLHIVGMTHHDIAERREEFVQTAVGRRIALRMACISEDGRTVEAYVGGECIGVVSKLDRDVAAAALRAEPKGVLHGRIVAAKDYELKADVVVKELQPMEPVASGLESWSFTGPLLSVRADERKLAFLEEELTVLLADGTETDVEEVLELVEAFCRTAPYDISGEGLLWRRQLVQWLDASADARLREAAERVREMSQRMGGDHWMQQLGEWMKTEMPTSREALTLTLEAAALDDVRGAAARLPNALLSLWRKDTTQFVRVLYGMQPSRQDLRRVLSCMVLLELTDGSSKQTAGTEGEFVKRLVTETKDFYLHNRTGANDMRQILSRLGQTDAKKELDAWIQAKEASSLELSDAQVAKAIEAICGEGRAVDKKQKWAGVYWCLRWYCNYPVKASDFCDRIARLPFSRTLNPECDYENIRKLATLSFMSQDARQLDSVKTSRGNEATLAECKTVVLALALEMQKMI